MSLEEVLRAELHDPQRALRPWPDAVDRVNAGIRRRRRRRAARRGAALTVMVAIAIPLALRATDAGAPRSNTPGSRTPSASASPIVRATAADCSSDHLVATLTPGTNAGEFLLTATNTGAVRCTLLGSPDLITLSAGSAQAVPAVESPSLGAANEEIPATIDPGWHAYATIRTSLACHGGLNPATYANVAIAQFGALVPATGSTLVTTCPVQVGPWYRIVQGG
jgi:hypothetical protein